VKRLIACVSLVALATTAAASSPSKPLPKKPGAVASAKHPAKCKVAPADEYFGKLKMSILGIRNTIRDQGLKVDVFPEKADSTLNAIALTEDAVRDWEHKYPCDTWLPGSIYALEHFYAKIHTADGVKHVHVTFAWLRHDFPKSGFVVMARKEDLEASLPSPAPPIAVEASPTPSPSN
jgi:hypothetical protein